MAGRRLRRITAILVVAVGLVVIGALATGEVALVTTHGISMEPTFHTGDLAVIVPSASYHVGEVVGYHSPLLHIVVLHRIVGEHGGLFTYKGDNNNFLDPVRTPASAIEGRLWLHIARGGIVLGWLRSPVVLGILAFLMMAFTAGGVTRRRARRPGGAAGRRLKPQRAAPGAVGVGWGPVAPASLLVALFTLVTLVAWMSPPTRPSQRAVPYQQTVSFSYAATAPRGVTYPTGKVTTGDPVFLQLVHSLEVGVHYALRSASSHRSGPAATVAGTMAATATLEGPGGWTAPLATLPAAAFSGPGTTIDLPLDLTKIPALENAFTFETGVPLDNPEIVLTPVLHLHGTLDDEPLGGVLAPSLSFRVDGSLLDVIGTSAGGDSQSTPAMTVSRSGSIEQRTLVPARLSLLGRSLAVTKARRLGLGGLVLSILAAVGGFLWWTQRRRMDETTRIHAAYGHDLVAVAASPTTQAPLVVEVATFEELARLARRYDCVILEHSHDAGHAYYVESGTTLYRCGVEQHTPVLVAAGPSAASPAVAETVAASPSSGPVGRRRLRSSSAEDDDRARIADDVDLLTSLARAELVSGIGDARLHLREAVILARKASLDGPLIDALVINARTPFDHGQESDPEKVELLQGALVLPADSPARRARLLSALAVESIFVRDGADRGPLLDEARQLAVQSGDSRTLIDVANGTFLARPRPSWSRRRFEQDRSLISQARHAAAVVDDPVDLANTQSHAAFCALIAGDGPALRQDLAALRETAGGGQNQIARRAELLLAQNIATLEGRLAQAEELSLEVSEADGRTTASVVESGRAVAQIALRREQDRLAELRAALMLDDEESAAASLARAARAFVLAETAGEDDAAILLHRADAVGWAGLPDDLHWSTAVALWSEVAATIGDRHAGAALHRMLLPHDGTALGSGPVGCGPASRLLALLETFLGQGDDANRHFAQAVAFSRELMSPVWVARCQLEWAEILLEGGDAPAAARLTDEADAAAGDLALPALGRQWTALRDRLDPGAF